MSFISEYLEFTKELESPHSFFLWSSIACVAAALRFNVYLPYGPRKIFPNIYVLLLANSGISRKSVPLGISADLLRATKATRVISGHTSIQAVLEELGNASGVMNQKGQIQNVGGACFLSAEELAAFFVSDPEAMTILTDMYDYRPEYEYNLKSAKHIIKDLCVSLLGASNETHLREVYTKRHVYGGLMGRTFFIRPDERRPPNSLIETISMPINGHYNTDKLISLLKDIMKMSGKFVIEDTAGAEYNNWYKKLHSEYQSKEDGTGVVSRIHTGVLKVAMNLAAGYTCEPIIRKTHIEESINHCRIILNNYEVFLMAAGKANDAQIGAILFQELLDEKNKNEVSRKLFIRNHWSELDEEQFDTLIKKLITAGMVSEKFDDAGTDMIFSITQLGRDKLREKIKARQEGNK